MIKVSISLVLSLLLLYGCQKSNPTIFYYQFDTIKSKHQYKIVRTQSLDTVEYYVVYDHLDSNYAATTRTTKRVITKPITDSVVYYNNLEFSTNRTVGNCHTFNFYLEEEFPLWDYTACLIRNVEDTVINGITIKSCSVYDFKKYGEVEERVIFDWTNRVLVEQVDLDTKASVRLMKIE